MHRISMCWCKELDFLGLNQRSSFSLSKVFGLIPWFGRGGGGRSQISPEIELESAGGWAVLGKKLCPSRPVHLNLGIKDINCLWLSDGFDLKCLGRQGEVESMGRQEAVVRRRSTEWSAGEVCLYKLERLGKTETRYNNSGEKEEIEKKMKNRNRTKDKRVRRTRMSRNWSVRK